MIPRGTRAGLQARASPHVPCGVELACPIDLSISRRVGTHPASQPTKVRTLQPKDLVSWLVLVQVRARVVLPQRHASDIVRETSHYLLITRVRATPQHMGHLSLRNTPCFGLLLLLQHRASRQSHPHRTLPQATTMMICDMMRPARARLSPAIVLV